MRDEEIVVEFPVDKLPPGVDVVSCICKQAVTLTVYFLLQGATLQLNSNQGPRPATLTKLTAETATLDLNDPIAGTDQHLKLLT
jgi:FKBP-type peptidyl-prolyl cis-trans isomerase 2